MGFSASILILGLSTAQLSATFLTLSHSHPPMARIFIKTYGCAHNQADSETMAGLLKKEGHTLVEDEEQSDLMLINSCTVKDRSEKRFLNDLKRTDKPKVIAGCVPQADSKNPFLQKFSTVGVANLESVTEVVQGTLKGQLIRKLEKTTSSRVTLPKVRKNPFIDIIPINSGCLGSCTFCKTKQSRGSLYSYPAQEIVTQFRLALREGVKEFWLTSEDTGAYGLDQGTSLSQLLKELTQVQGDYRIRVGMTNPEHVLRDLENLLAVFQRPNVFKFAHIPVQSGSNRVLKLMKREYTKEQFIYIAKAFKKAIPNITLATDLICGFPSETQEEFEESWNLIEECQIKVVNISKFYPRPNTRAAKMKEYSTKIAKPRTLLLANRFRKWSEKLNLGWLGWKGEIIVDEKNKDAWVGRNDSYVPIVVESKKDLFGKRIKIEIIAAKPFCLIGKMR